MRTDNATLCGSPISRCPPPPLSFPPSCAASTPFLQEPQGILFIYSLLGNQSCRNRVLPTLQHPQTPPPIPPYPTAICGVVLSSPETFLMAVAPRSRRWGIFCMGKRVMAEWYWPATDRVYAYGDAFGGASVTENEQRSRWC